MRTALRARQLRALAVLAGLAMIAVVVGGIAWATIPENGVYTGCYHKSNGNLRVIDASETCKSTETRITWNQQGAQGDQGPPGSGAALKFQAWTTGQPGEHIVFTDANDGEDVPILTMDRPNGGAPPWDKTIVIANVSFLQLGEAPFVDIFCRAEGGAAYDAVTVPTSFRQPGGIFATATIIGDDAAGESTTSITCRTDPNRPAGSVEVEVETASIALLPASSIELVYP